MSAPPMSVPPEQRTENNMIKNIIFDIGNVLADFRWRAFLQEKGFSEAMINRIAAATVEHPVWSELDRGAWSEEQLMEAFVANDPEIEREIREAFGNMSGMVTLRDYALDWVKELKAKGYGVYYLSNFGKKVEAECADSLAFLPLMDGGILSYQDQLIKPDAAIYELLLNRYDLRAEECVFLDDTQKNVDGAENCGIHGICFQTKQQAQEELRKLGVEA